MFKKKNHHGDTDFVVSLRRELSREFSRTLSRTRTQRDTEIYGILEQAVELGVDLLDNLTKVFFLFGKFDIIDIDDQELSHFVGRDPCFIALVEPFEVIDTDGLRSEEHTSELQSQR